MKLFFWIFTFIFLIIGNVNSEEAFKCKTDLRSADNDEENALRLQMCWNELNSKSEKTQKYFLKPGIYVFIYNGNENLYLAADDNAAQNEMPAVEKGLKLCSKDSNDCSVWTIHVFNEMKDYIYDDSKWVQHAYDRRVELTQ